MTTHQGLRLATGVVVENMGDTVLVMIPGVSDVLRLNGRSAEIVTAVSSGHPVSDEDGEFLDELARLGVVTTPISRRSLLRVGAIGAGAGVAILALPGVAAASSVEGAGPELEVFFVGGASSGGRRTSILVGVRRRGTSTLGITPLSIGDLAVAGVTLPLELQWGLDPNEPEAFFRSGLDLDNDDFNTREHTLTFLLDGALVSLSFVPDVVNAL